MTEDGRLEEDRELKRFDAAQRRRVALHALRYGWRDGTTEVETAGLLVIAALGLGIVARVPALYGLRDLRLEALLVLMGLLVLGVETLATGFRYHVSQGVGGLVGRPRVNREVLVGGALALVLSLAVLATSVLSIEHSTGALPLGVVGGALAVAGVFVGAMHGTRRMVLASLLLATVGWGWDRLLGIPVLDHGLELSLGFLSLALVPLVSGVIGFHEYRRDVSERHDDYVRDAIALLHSPSASSRAVAAEALGRLGGLEAAEPLVRALGDSATDVRIAAAFALGEVRELVPARLVARRLDLRGYAPEDSVPRDVMEEVAQLARLEWQDDFAERFRQVVGDPAVMRALLDAASTDQPAPVRRTAVRVLAETRHPDAVAHLAEMLCDDCPDTRSAARGALAWTGAAGVRALAPLVSDRRDQLRREACAALLGLLRYSKDAEEIRVQRELCEGQLPAASLVIGDPALDWVEVAAMAQNCFSTVVGDGDELVREAAAIALDLLGEEKAAAR